MITKDDYKLGIIVKLKELRSRRVEINTDIKQLLIALKQHNKVVMTQKQMGNIKLARDKLYGKPKPIITKKAHKDV